MIENKLLPSIYLVEITGKNIEAIIPGNFGIEKIVLASETMSDDMSAYSALQGVFSALGETATETQFNPEFFPSLPKIKLSAEQVLEKEAIERFIESNSMENGDVPVAVTQFFDKTGDFVVSRILSKSGELIGRIAIDPQVYVKEKSAEEDIKRVPFIDYRDMPQLRMH